MSTLAPPNSVTIDGSFNEKVIFHKSKVQWATSTISPCRWKLQSWAGFNFKPKMLKKKAPGEGVSQNFGEVGLSSRFQPGAPAAACWCCTWEVNEGFSSPRWRKRGGVAPFTRTGKRKNCCGGVFKIIVPRRKWLHSRSAFHPLCSWFSKQSSLGRHPRLGDSLPYGSTHLI